MRLGYLSCIPVELSEATGHANVAAGANAGISYPWAVIGIMVQLRSS